MVRISKQKRRLVYPITAKWLVFAFALTLCGLTGTFFRSKVRFAIIPHTMICDTTTHVPSRTRSCLLKHLIISTILKIEYITKFITK
jgi:hypothetical protein